MDNKELTTKNIKEVLRYLEEKANIIGPEFSILFEDCKNIRYAKTPEIERLSELTGGYSYLVVTMRHLMDLGYIDRVKISKVEDIYVPKVTESDRVYLNSLQKEIDPARTT